MSNIIIYVLLSATGTMLAHFVKWLISYIGYRCKKKKGPDYSKGDSRSPFFYCIFILTHLTSIWQWYNFTK